MLGLRNDFIMAPIKTGYSDGTGRVTEKHLRFYAERAKYVGAITPEPFYLHRSLRELPTQMGIDSVEQISGLQQLTSTIQQAGAKAIAHLNHPGRMANPMIPGNVFLSSSDQACEAGGATPRLMNQAEISEAIDLFRQAAIRAADSGFDIIELQFGHGYLISQFISAKINTRTDEYGGVFANRIRFGLEVLDAVKNAVSIPLIVRLSGDEMIPDGIHTDEMIELGKILKTKGVEALHVSAGTACNTPPWYFQHMFVPKGKTWEFGHRIQKEVGLPVIFVGQINTHADINFLKQNYDAKIFAIGRALVADPDFVGKLIQEVEGNYRPCLACAEGCLGGVKSGKGLQCLVNPTVGKNIGDLQPAPDSKDIAIVGGGLAGMEAALTLKKRGHKVTLFEKESLGGQFNLAWLPPHKENLKKLIDYYKHEMIDNQIDINYVQANEQILERYSTVVLATGAIPKIPPIPGLDKYYWAEVLQDENLPENSTAAVIGGGLIGTEIASKLLSRGNEVYLVEILEDIARGMEMIEQKLTLNSFKNERMHIYTKTRVTQIDGEYIQIEGEDFVKAIKAKHIIIATGMQSYRPIESLNNKEVYYVGDASKVGKAQDAIAMAYELAIQI
ncbi:MAG: FAD-dependent oxidoreductase [Bacteroidales bacterium]|nr:FAD-dependent oxidoreductase [Bacteroidales bacterium]